MPLPPSREASNESVGLPDGFTLADANEDVHLEEEIAVPVTSSPSPPPSSDLPSLSSFRAAWNAELVGQGQPSSLHAAGSGAGGDTEDEGGNAAQNPDVEARTRGSFQYRQVRHATATAL